MEGRDTGSSDISGARVRRRCGLFGFERGGRRFSRSRAAPASFVADPDPWLARGTERPTGSVGARWPRQRNSPRNTRPADIRRAALRPHSERQGFGSRSDPGQPKARICHERRGLPAVTCRNVRHRSFPKSRSFAQPADWLAQLNSTPASSNCQFHTSLARASGSIASNSAEMQVSADFDFSSDLDSYDPSPSNTTPVEPDSKDCLRHRALVSARQSKRARHQHLRPGGIRLRIRLRRNIKRS